MQGFERLVKAENDVEDDELLTGDRKREANENGVKNNAKFKDEDACKLGCVGFG